MAKLEKPEGASETSDVSTTLKRLLSDPANRIELDDFVGQLVADVIPSVTADDFWQLSANPDAASIQMLDVPRTMRGSVWKDTE